MRYLVVLLAILVPASSHGQVKSNDPPQETRHPRYANVKYQDPHRIAPQAALKHADVSHPYLPGETVTIELYAPDWRPQVKVYRRKIVYDYGAHEVKILYRKTRLIVDYDGPKVRRPINPGQYPR